MLVCSCFSPYTKDRGGGHGDAKWRFRSAIAEKAKNSIKKAQGTERVHHKGGGQEAKRKAQSTRCKAQGARKEAKTGPAEESDLARIPGRCFQFAAPKPKNETVGSVQHLSGSLKCDVSHLNLDPLKEIRT